MDRDKFDEMMAKAKERIAPGTFTDQPQKEQESEQQGMQFGFDVVEVRRVGLQPGEVLMVTVKNDDLSQESVDMLRKQLNAVFPNNKVFVFAMGTSDDVNLEIVSPAKQPELTPWNDGPSPYPHTTQIIGGGGGTGGAGMPVIAERGPETQTYILVATEPNQSYSKLEPSPLNEEEIQALKELDEQEDEHMKRLAEQAENGKKDESNT